MKTAIANEQRATLAAARVRKLQDIRPGKSSIEHFPLKPSPNSIKLLYFMHWRRQLWGTGARAPLDFQQKNYFFQFILELHKVRQQLCAVACPNIFVFCDSSCGSSVAATRTLFSVLFRVILCATESFI